MSVVDSSFSFEGFEASTKSFTGSDADLIKSVIGDFEFELDKFPAEKQQLQSMSQHRFDKNTSVQNSTLKSVASTGIMSSLSSAASNAVAQTSFNRRGPKFTPTNIHDERYLKPFDYGWTRELVYRATNDQSDMGRKRKGDIYYYSPSGKKARSYREIQLLLHDDLTLENFTFAKEVIGAENEIVREANSRPRGYRLPTQILPKNRIRSRRISESSDSMPQQNNFMIPEINHFEKPFPIQLHIDERFEKYIPNRSLLQDSAYAYSTIFDVFRLIRVQDLLSCAQVCKMWHRIAHDNLIWAHVVMKNSTLTNLDGLIQALNKHNTRSLDLRKMIIAKTSQSQDAIIINNFWSSFVQNFGKVQYVTELKMCRCPSSVLEHLPAILPDLLILQACQIDGRTLNFDNFSKFNQIHELKLKSTSDPLEINSTLNSIGNLNSLRIFSLLSIRNLNTLNLEPLTRLDSLEDLELGECADMDDNFAKNVLPKLIHLKRFRIEKGNNMNLCTVLNTIQDLKTLERLELINVDVRVEFDSVIEKCTNLKKLLLVPNYITLSATTNQLVLNGVSKLKDTLEELVWVITNELLRVTELFIDQCEESLQNKIKKQQMPFLNNNGNNSGGNNYDLFALTNIKSNNMSNDSIPILKPIALRQPPFISNGAAENGDAMETENEASTDSNVDECSTSAASRGGRQSSAQVEILSLPLLHRMLLDAMPNTKIRILKVPFSATWKQVL